MIAHAALARSVSSSTNGDVSIGTRPAAMTKSAEAELKNSATPGMILPGCSQNTRSAGGHSQSASVKLEAMSCCVCVRVPRGWPMSEREPGGIITRTLIFAVSKEVHAQGKVGGTVITGPGRRIAPHYRPGSEAVRDGGRGGSLQPHCESPNAPLDDPHTDVGQTASLASNLVVAQRHQLLRMVAENRG